MNFRETLQFQTLVNRRRHIEHFLANTRDKAVFDAMARGEMTAAMPPGMEQAIREAVGAATGMQVIMQNATGTPEGDAMIAEAEMTAKKNTKVH